MKLNGLKIALVGPLPPPEGGMANQTRQLAELLRSEGASVTLVQTNAPCSPQWLERVRGLRGIVRLVPYVVRLWRAAGDVDVFHVMANSGWSWHLCAAPAVWIARVRRVPSVVNYRGGEAEAFLERSASSILRTLRQANALAVPSGFLERVFRRWGMPSSVVPNIVDLQRFSAGPQGEAASDPHIVVARALEPIYDIPSALRAFALVRKAHPRARLTIAGAGPERDALLALSESLGIRSEVNFCGRLSRERMADLYRRASLLLNPARIDNMPNSLLEAMASGVPIVSTSAGGVPYIVRDGITALLVPPGDHVAMAQAMQRLVQEPRLARALRDAALQDVQKYTWPRIRDEWTRVYEAALCAHRAEGKLV